MKSTFMCFVFVVAVFLMSQQQIQAEETALLARIRTLEENVRKLQGQEVLMNKYKNSQIRLTILNFGTLLNILANKYHFLS